MKVRQIADRIPKSYRAENGSQLTVSLPSTLTVPTADGVSVPVRAVVVRPDTSKGLADEDDIDVYPAGNIISFGLCGTKSKQQCEVTPTNAKRDTLLRRQALELSLYTFKYVDSVNSVVVFMPPTAETQHTIFLRRSEVSNELGRPLSSLLPSVKPRVGALSATERGQILRLTQPRTYAAEVQASPDGSPVLILTPPGEATG